MRLGRNAAAVCAVALLGGPVMAAHASTIAENGVARAAVVVAGDAPPPEQHAADELARFLKQVTGGDFAVVKEAPPGAPGSSWAPRPRGWPTSSSQPTA